MNFKTINIFIITASLFLVPAQLMAASDAVELSRTARGFTNKSVHGNDEHNYYKRPNTGSFTGPFDYGSAAIAVEAPAQEQPTGKCNCFTFDGTKSFDPDKQKLTYAWDFGDGQKSDQAVAKHCFDKAGDYSVTLTVRDDSGEICGNGVTSVKVSANFPPTANAGENQVVCLGEEVSFDGSASTAAATPTYSWDFGDGEKGEGETVSHNYQKPGNYRVRLLVDDGKKTECSVAQHIVGVTVNERAEVSLAEVAPACIGQSVHFQANGSGVSKYTWDFGDGTTMEGGSGISHVYQKSGTYTVRVTGDSGRGGDCSIASDRTSVVINASPIAKAGDNLACCVGKDVAFDGSGSSSPNGKKLSYHWNFGDGESADGMKVSHAYAKSGNYRVVLTVSDDSGSTCASASDSFVANVNAKPESVIEVR